MQEKAKFPCILFLYIAITVMVAKSFCMPPKIIDGCPRNGGLIIACYLHRRSLNV